MFKYMINTRNDLDLLVDYMKDQDIFAYDTETNGQKDRFKIQMVGLSIGFDLFSVYIPLNHLWDDTPQLFLPEVIGALKPFFEDETIAKICHNVKFDEMVMKRHGVTVAGEGHDTFIQAWMLEGSYAPKGSKALKTIIKNIYKYQMTTYEEVIEQKHRKKADRDYNFARVSAAEALDYAADDAYWTYHLFHRYKRELIRQKLWVAYQNIDRPFSRVLGNMEETGVSINHEYVKLADKRFPEIADKVEGDIYRHAGKVFKIGAPKQLGQVLFDELKVQKGKRVPLTRTKQYATDAKTLAKFTNSHPIVGDIFKLKKVSKAHSTFVVGLQNNLASDGKVHASFNGCGTRTGRLSCNNPNLQQVEGGTVEDIKIRNFFVPSEGNSFVVSDYSQIELRVMAHLAKDKTMIDAFLSGMDFHDATAREMLKIEGEVDRKSRVIAKTLNFGVGYGRGAQGIAEQIGCSEAEGQAFIDKWFATFDGVAAYKDHVVHQARIDGFVRTISGRKRRLLPEIRSTAWGTRMGAERQAFNTKIQGSAADLIKMSMIYMLPRLDKIGAKIVIQIHDELVVEAPQDRLEEASYIVKDSMENPMKGKNPLRLPLVTEPSIVSQWGDAK